jgi:site-specific DNA recombinase
MTGYTLPPNGLPSSPMSITAREYLRVSEDRTGRLQSPEEQHHDNERAAAEHGWTLGQPYRETASVSASRYSKRARDQFTRLSDDLTAGRFDAQILILWESSRGSRRVGEWATLIDALEDAGVKVYVTSHGHLYDPANHRDRRSLQEDAVDSEYESGKSSVRIRRAAAATAALGEPHGRIPYGYTRRYDPVTRRLTAQESDPVEKPVVVEIFTRIRDGHSLRSIAIDFEARGIRTRTGKLFDAQHLRDIALRPAYAGLRIHVPGNRSGRYQGPLDGAVTATWPALVDAETFYTVRRLLQNPDRKTTRPGRGVHLLSLIAECAICSGPMAASYRRGRRDYECKNSGHVHIDADDLDAYATRIMLGYLASPDVIRRLRRIPEGDAEVARLDAELAAARSELEGWTADAAAGRVSRESFRKIEPGVLARIRAMEARQGELTTPVELVTIRPGVDVAERWEAAPVPARRQVCRLLCSPPVLGTLKVGHAPVAGQRVHPAARVIWDRDTPDEG